MGQLYDAKVRLDRIIAERGLDASETKGKLSLRSGVLLAFLRADTPDDPAKLEKLRAAVRDLLQTEV